MLRYAIALCLTLVVLSSGSPLAAQRPLAGYIPETVASRQGLTAAWQTVVAIDPGSDEIERLVLSNGLLMAQSRKGMIQAMDAETGRTIFTVRRGDPRQVTSAPNANNRYVAWANGSTLYVVNRSDGTFAWEKQLRFIPSTGITLTDTRVYVPLANGGVESYLLDRETVADELPKILFAAGLPTEPLVVDGEWLLWGTDKGFAYAEDTATARDRVRLKTGGPILGALEHWETMVYAASKDGSLYAFDKYSGDVAWRQTLGKALRYGPAISGNTIFATVDGGGLAACAVEDGRQLWYNGGATRILSISPSRLYATDANGQILVFDVQTGGRLGAIPAPNTTLKMTNHHNDRLYLGTTTGLVQCLHESDLPQPAVRGQVSEAAASPSGSTPATAAPATAEDSPF